MSTQGGAAQGSVRSLVKTSYLTVSKVTLFSHSETSHKKFTLATRKSNILKVLVRIKIELHYKDRADVDKLAKAKNGVKHLRVRQDLFDRIADAKRMKTKGSREIVSAFLTVITKRVDPTKLESTRELNLMESSKQFAKLK